MTTNRPNPNSRNTTLLSVAVFVAVLYFARDVFIPLALALLFAFLLAPLVMRLRRWGLWRMPAVLIVVTAAFLAMAGVADLMVVQLTELGRKMPEYEQNLHKKAQSIRDSSSGFVGHFSRVMRDFDKELNPSPSSSSTNQPIAEGQKPVPVEIQHGPTSPLQFVPQVLGSVVGLLLTVVIVTVFVIFMLLQQEDLRDRVIRLVGARQLNATTKALDEAGERVSSYLVAQLLVNVAFGIPAGIALYFLGVPNPILWGMLAALFRYVPYLGIWIAAFMPAAVLFAVDPGWIKPFSVFGIYFGIDIIMYNLVEPLVYRNSTGMTPLAILVAAVFWTWLWGPVGLLLATPLTVCIAVLGRYVPSLRFLGVMLSDEPVLTPDKRFYQRLLAMDLEEAAQVAEDFLKDKPLVELYDTVIIPALSLAEADRRAGKLDDEQEQFIYHNARMLVEDFAPRARESAVEGDGEPHRKEDESQEHPAEPEMRVLSLPSRTEADEIAALMLAQLLNARGIGTKPMAASAFASERLEEIGREKIQLACVSSVPPDGHLHTRYFCKRLRAQFPEMKIVVAILVGGNDPEARQKETSVPADEMARSLAEAVAEISSLLPVTTARTEQKAFSS